MKHFSKFMIGALALGLWSCSSDEPLAGGGDNNGGTTGDFNATLTLQLPTAGGTRSATTPDGTPAGSEAGVEIGQISENNVDQVLVVLATRDETDLNKFTYVTYGLSTAAVLKDEEMPTYALQFESTDLANRFGQTMYVFAYCNPTDEIVGYFKGKNDKTDWLDQVAEIASYESSSIWAKNSFLMTNATISKEITLQDQEGQDINDFFEKHSTATTAFDLGQVTVERVAARFDFQELAATTDHAANTYTVKDNRNDDNVATVTFTDMALFNVAKGTYYIPRVSDNGLPTGENFAICGNERFSMVNKTGNWVVGPYATQFPANASASTDRQLYEALFGNYFYQLDGFTTYDDMNWTSLANWSNQTPDNHENWTDATGTDYRIWCYTTENVMPGEYNQRQGTTTGVMFKAELHYLPEGTEGADNEQAKVIRESMTAGHQLYALNGVIYGDVAHVALYATIHPYSDLARAYKKSGMADMDGNKNLVEASESAGKYQIKEGAVGVDCTAEQATKAGFSVYKPVKDAQDNYHYYMYYPYFNRHNSFGANNDGMSVMEYQVVRNNVYKLKVSSVLSFGHADKGFDPEPPGDGTPDETKKVLFRVSVQVLPWVVRVNDIVFN